MITITVVNKIEQRLKIKPNLDQLKKTGKIGMGKSLESTTRGKVWNPAHKIIRMHQFEQKVFDGKTELTARNAIWE